MASVGITLGRHVRVMSLVGAAHFLSHFYYLALPPLFFVLVTELNTSYVALGFLITVFNLTGSLATTPVGFLVDRWGARRVLVGGLVLQAAATGAVGLTDSYAVWLVLFGVAGLAFSVYHPADYAIMSASIPERWRGRAFSVHACTGNLGSAAVPLTMVWLHNAVGWRTGLVSVGIVGVVLALLIATQRDVLSDEKEAGRKAAKADPSEAAPAPTFRQDLATLFSGPILMCFLFYVISHLSLGGLRAFAPAALVDMSGAPAEQAGAALAAANAALTAFMVATAAGILAGGWIADRLGPRVGTAVLGLILSAGLLFVIGGVPMPIVAVAVVLSLSGFIRGMVQSTRDLIVLSVTPKGATGKVFAFVYNGSTIGGMVMPLVFGWVLDHGLPAGVFWVAGGSLVLALLTFLGIDRAIARGRRSNLSEAGRT